MQTLYLHSHGLGFIKNIERFIFSINRTAVLPFRSVLRAYKKDKEDRLSQLSQPSRI
jgi:hypothetical protein